MRTGAEETETEAYEMTRTSKQILGLLLVAFELNNSLALLTQGQNAAGTHPGVTVLASRWYPFKFDGKSEALITAMPKPGPGVPTDRPAADTRGDALRSKQFFFYETIVRNDSAKTILSIAWDHVFIDRDNREEGRIPLSWIDSKIAKGKTQQLKKARTLPPTMTVNAGDAQQTLTEKNRDQVHRF